MTDSAGTVRKSLDGFYVIRTNPEGQWFSTEARALRRWFVDSEVADWEVVYTPKPDIGTIKRRKTQWGTEVAVMTYDGWIVVDHDGGHCVWGDEFPPDDKDGQWEEIL